MPDTPPIDPPPSGSGADQHVPPVRRPGQTWASLVDEQIRAAQAAGKFDNLASAGRPLNLDRNPYEGDRAVEFDILRTHGLAPREISLGKEIDQDLARAEHILEELRHRRNVLRRRRVVTRTDRRVYNAFLARAALRYVELLHQARSAVLSLNIIAPAIMHRSVIDVEQLMRAFHTEFPPLAEE